LYGLLVARLARRGASWPAWAGLALCLVVAVVTQGLYATVAHTPLVYGLGMLLGLGTIWFLGALVALHGAWLIRRPGVRAVTRVWPVLVAGVMAWGYAKLPPQGMYLISGVAFTLMLLGFMDAPATTPEEEVSKWRARGVETLGLM